MTDHKGFLPPDLEPELEGLDEEDALAFAAAQQRQRSCIRRFLGVEQGAPSAPKRYRVATFRMVQALDHALWLLTEAGLEQFVSGRTKLNFLQPEMRQKVEAFLVGPPRGVFLAADQCSVGLSLAAFLTSGDRALNLELLFDPPHRFWNTEKLGLLASHSWESVLLTSIPYAVNDGPWLSSGFHEQVQAAKREYLASTDQDSCPLLAHYIHRIAVDMKKEGKAHTGAFREFVWAQLREASELRHKGPKPALCRWYAWCDSHSHWRRFWHLRLLLLYLWGMGCGVVTRGTTAQSFKLSALPSVSWTEKKETMKEQGQKHARIRAKGKSMLHVSLLVLGNPVIKRKADCVYEALQAMRLFHGQQVKTCMTSEGNVDWSVSMAHGAWLKPLLSTWELLTCPSTLVDCGFLVSAHAVEAAGLSPGALTEEADWAEWAVYLLISLTRIRYRYMVFYSDGPGALAGLLSQDGDARKATLARLKSLWLAWEASAASAQPFCLEARSRSWLARPVVEAVMTSLASTGFEELPQVTEGLVRSMFSFVTTKVVEDAFQRLRFLETQGQANKKVTAKRMYALLVNRDPLSKVHKFPAVSFQDIGEKRAFEELPRTPSQACYSPGSRKPLLPLHQVQSTDSAVGVSVSARAMLYLSQNGIIDLCIPASLLLFEWS